VRALSVCRQRPKSGKLESSSEPATGLAVIVDPFHDGDELKEICFEVVPEKLEI
jgi:hypothetical protein